jgi:hypothetical protein
MPRYRGHHRSRSHRLTAGQQAARRHIEEARQFEREMGGTVSDVKKYFFSLNNTQLDAIFAAYSSKYGPSKEEYARYAFSRWRSGSIQMSGLVAKRLFEFLPQRMPIATKLELAGNVWRHFGTSSSRHYTVGPNADPHLVIDRIRETLTSVIQDYHIPENVKNRFDWLAGGDVSVKEHFLNYFRQMDKKIATDSLYEQLPVLQAQMRNHSGHTGSIHTRIQIHKHSVQIWIDPRLGGEFREGQPERKASTSSSTYGVIWFLVVAAVLIAIIYLSHR